MNIESTHITISLMKRLKPGDERRFRDTELNGFQTWVGKRSVSYYLRKRHSGKEYSVKLGTWPSMTPDEARASAIEKLSALENHGDINAVSSRKIPTLREAASLFMATHDRNKGDYERIFRKFSFMDDMKVTEFTEDLVTRRFSSLIKSSPFYARKIILVMVSAIRRICAETDTEFRFDAKKIGLKELTVRTRFLSEQELIRFFDAVEKMRKTKMEHLSDILLMLVYTGARKKNVLDMKIEDVSESGVWKIPASRFKGKRDHYITLGTEEMKIVRRNAGSRTCGYLFVNRYGRHTMFVDCCMKYIRKESGIQDFRLHDLRRTLGTWMLSSGAPIAVVSKKLGHASIAMTEKVYAHVMPDIEEKYTEDTIKNMRRRK